MITETDMLNIKAFVENAIDMNPDKGIITATREACNFYGVIAPNEDIDAIAFDIVRNF